MKSKFIILVGPSGCGKTTIMQELVKQHPKIKYARSFTTRPYRDKSDDDMYCFVSEEDFLKKKKEGEFFEIIQYAGYWYGTPKFEYEKAVKGKYHVIKALDSDGALTVKKLLGEDCILFYIHRKKEHIIKSLIERAIANPSLIDDVATRILNIPVDFPTEHIVYNSSTVKEATRQVLRWIPEESTKYVSAEDICVCCGSPVPEGTMVCASCQAKLK